MKPKVYFLAAKDPAALEAGLPKVLRVLIDADFGGNLSCGIKLHVGEKGNKTFVPPGFAKEAVRFLKEKGAKPFLFETSTLYYGKRGNAPDHLALAAQHGFGVENVGAPMVIADGMHGEDGVEVPIKGELLRQARLGSLLPQIPAVLGLSHFKGHMLTGFGGSIKNFSMGTSARGGKLEMHSLSKPWIDAQRCTACGECAEQCPEDAIKTRGEEFVIIHDKCSGCAGCIGVCPSRAVRIHWDRASESASAKMAEYALASLKEKEGFFLNFLLNVTKNCDCLGEEMEPITENVGILGSRDPVALDQASLDKVDGVIRSAHPEVDPEVQLAHGERVGLGKRVYNLEEL